MSPPTAENTRRKLVHMQNSFLICQIAKDTEQQKTTRSWHH